MTQFSDGASLDTTGEIRVEESGGSFYVLGEGLLLPADTREAADALCQDVKSQIIYMNMKVLKSPGARSRVNAALEEIAAEIEEPRP